MHRLILQTILALLLAAPALAQWTPAVRISEQNTSFGPRIAASGDTLHVVYWKGGGYISAYYAKTENAGINWEEPLLLSDTANTSNSISPIIRVIGHSVFAAWRYTAGPSRWNFGFRCSSDGGENWNDIISIIPTDNYELQKHTFSIGGGVIYFIYSRWANDIIVEIAKSSDLGQTWTNPFEVFRTEQTGLFDMVAGGDTIHFVWAGQFSWEYPVWETYYIKSEDSGETWTDNVSLGSIDELGSMYPSIAINERGDLVVCWVDYKYSPYWWTGDLFVRYSYDAGESWTDEEQIIFTHTAESPRILWQGDSLHIAWQDSRFGGPDPFYMASYDNGLTWEEEQRIDSDPFGSFTPDLAVAGEKIHVVWDENRQYDQGRGIYYSRWDEEVGIEENKGILPSEFTLTAYPNPFNGNTTITYNLSEGGEIEIYSITGQLIRRLGTITKEGKIMWDARDALGNKVSSGIYFARARAPQNSNTLKLLYLK